MIPLLSTRKKSLKEMAGQGALLGSRKTIESDLSRFFVRFRGAIVPKCFETWARGRRLRRYEGLKRAARWGEAARAAALENPLSGAMAARTLPTVGLADLAQAAGVTKRLWEMSDIIDVLEVWEQSVARKAA